MSSPEWLHITQEEVLAKVPRPSGKGSGNRADPTHVDAEVAQEACATQQGTGDAKRGDGC